MRQRRQRGDDANGRAVMRGHLLGGSLQAEIDHLRNRALRGRGLVRRRQPGLDKAQQRLGEERVVIGRAVADLHRLPHRLGDPSPGRVDQRPRRRMRDEDPRQIEQQRRVLVAAGIEPGQRHQHFAPAHVGIADQVEGRVGRDETVFRERTQEMRAAMADHALDLGQLRGAAVGRCRRRLRVADADRRHQFGHRLADRGPVRLVVVAGAGQRLAQPLQPPRILQLRQPGPAQQRPQGRVAERRPVEFSKMGVAAAVFSEHGIADVIERRAVLLGGQRAQGGAGEMVEAHAVSFRRYRKSPKSLRRSLGRSEAPAAASGPKRACTPRKPLENYMNPQETQMEPQCDGCHITPPLARQ